MESHQGRQMMAFDINTICDKLRLPLLIDSEDMSFHWKA